MKTYFYLLFFSSFLLAESLDIKALKLIANDKNQTIELIDNVVIKKGNDELFASKVIMRVDNRRVPINYSAYGGVKFRVTTKNNRIFQGKSNEAYYDALTGEYRLIGDGIIKENNTINVVTGDEIILNNDTGYVNVVGSRNRPAKLIFELEEKPNPSK